jgi:fluoride exporter
MVSFLWVSLGAIAGALLRWGLSNWLNPVLIALPLGTLLANGLGAYLAGLSSAVFLLVPSLPEHYRLLVIIGFLGSLTTFSGFALEVVTLLQQGRWVVALGLTLLHTVGSVVLVLLGLQTVTGLKRFL